MATKRKDTKAARVKAVKYTAYIAVDRYGQSYGNCFGSDDPSWHWDDTVACVDRYNKNHPDRAPWSVLKLRGAFTPKGGDRGKAK